MAAKNTSPHDKIAVALKEIKRIQSLMAQGLGKAEEKAEAFRLAKEAATLFTDDILKRKAEKQSLQTVWTSAQRGGFLPAREASELDGWVGLLQEFIDARKIKSELSSEKINIQSVVDGEDQHIFITEKGSGEHAHLIIDGGTGEIRIDPKDKAPQDLIKSVQATLQFKTGESVQITKTAMNFVEPESPQPDVRAYTAMKDGYFVLEVYNNGDEDLEAFSVKTSWVQPPPEGAQERVVEQFNSEADYLVMAAPKSLNMLKKGERVYAHIVSISVDKKVKVTISCKGMKSGKAIEKVFELETQNQYK